MFKLFSLLFSSNTITNKMTDLLGDALETKEQRINIWVELLKSYEPFRVAQRVLLVVVSFVYLGIHLILVLLKIVAIFYYGAGLEYQFVCVQLGKLHTSNYEALHSPFLVILSFYFGGGAGEGIIRMLKSKKSE